MMKCMTTNHLKNENKNKKGDFPWFEPRWNWRNQNCLEKIKFWGRLNFTYFDAIRGIKSSKITKKDIFILS